ncbi:transglycosylase domain-containing protein [Oceanobacillus alkalisoli]|uniref:transglycosylase domain-containing protein n=1 Tax=Oceanobacillus alkalisoli TaxID=2925113 RepID=UPI001EE3B136|nr:transglycosylase domain-containing protein [Oceanobacillus alkalisoli]MCG5102008.1 penicillin-binding protein [Oceanobacillus alkalisoli]
MDKPNQMKLNLKLKWIVISFISIISLVLAGYAIIIYFGSQIVDDNALILAETTTIETIDGEVIAELYQENRDYILLDDIPEHVQEAYIAIEDRRFYEHSGIDIKSIMRAVYRDIIAMSKVEGASTITQQLVKNLFLYNDKTWTRKAKEASAAIYLERNLSKEEILELYLNEIYFGHGVYGIEKAANYYFSKHASELSIGEGALLAGLAKAPNGYSPIDHPEKALERRNVVLGTMKNAGMISAETKQMEQGKTLGLQLEESASTPWVDSYVDLVIKEAQEKSQLPVDELRRGGYRIVVGLDETIQQKAYEMFEKDDYFPGNTSDAEGAFVMMEQTSGKIIAAIGGRDYTFGDLNRVTVNRQPGSTFKPLAVYGPALMQEDTFTPYSLLPDEQAVNGDYSVANVDDMYQKAVSIYDSLVASKNVPAVWLLNQIGIPYAKSYLEKMDMLIEDQDLAIALGGLHEGVTPLNLIEAYRTFAQDGKFMKAYTIEGIYDHNESLIYENNLEEREVFTPQVAWNMTEMLMKAVDALPEEAGTYSKALAGKTGTTQHPQVENEVKDAWFVGFTPEFVLAAWTGYDKSDADHYLTGGSVYPTRLIQDILTEIDKLHPLAETFEKPDTVEALAEPVQIAPVTNVQAAYEWGGFSLVRGKISWDPLHDDRAVYRVYEERDGIDRRVGEVQGESEYVIDHALFKHKKYYVVTYDPFTKLESRKSETVILN